MEMVKQRKRKEIWKRFRLWEHGIQSERTRENRIADRAQRVVQLNAGSFSWWSSIRNQNFHLWLQEEEKEGGKSESWLHWKKNCMKRGSKNMKVKFRRYERWREDRFSSRDCKVRVRGKETEGLEIKKEKKNKKRRKRAKNRKRKGLCTTPLTALHNACGVIWCM